MTESHADLRPIRCFLGVPLDVDLAVHVSSLLNEELQPALVASSQKASSMPPVPAPRIVASGNLHLTLAFLGDQPLSLIDTLHRELQQSLAACQAFTLRSRTIDTFPDAKSAIIALEFIPVDALHHLKRTLDVVLKHNAVAVEPRPLRPHVTLARGKKGQQLVMMPRACELELKVNQVCLFESRQGAAGSDYRPLWSIPLGENTVDPPCL